MLKWSHYLVHPHKILPARFKFYFNAVEQILPANAIKNEIYIRLGIRDTVEEKTMTFISGNCSMLGKCYKETEKNS